MWLLCCCGVVWLLSMGEWVVRSRKVKSEEAEREMVRYGKMGLVR